MKKTQLGLLAVLLGLSLSTSVFAHDSIGFSLNIGQPYYYDYAPPVYYSPPPVVYYEPRPVYREYYGAYYYPSDDRYYANDDWKEHHEHHEHHRHHEHDDDD